MFTHSSRAASIRVIRKLTFECVLNPANGICYGPSGDMYQCKSGTSDGSHCDVSGGEMLLMTQGIHSEESPWNSYGYLVALFVILRFSSLFLMYYPFEKIIFTLQKLYYSPHILSEILTNHLQVRTLRGQVFYLLHTSNDVEEKEDKIRIEKAYSTKLIASKAADSDSDAETSHASMSKAPSLRIADEPLKSSLVWKNLSLKLKTGSKATLIDDVSGSVECGTVLALMGPSGAGETMLYSLIPYDCLTP